MTAEISENEKKRAANIIWSAARSYDFTPDIRAFTADGEAELYLNCIIGAVRFRYDYEALEKLLLSTQSYEDADTYEGLIWLGLENAVYGRELCERPFLAELRRDYAKQYIEMFPPADDGRLYDCIARAHWLRVLGLDDGLNRFDKPLLDELEFSPELETEELVKAGEALLQHWFLIEAGRNEPKEKSLRDRLRGLNRTPFTKKLVKKKAPPRYRRFLAGLAERSERLYGGEGVARPEEAYQFSTRLSREELQDFIRFKYGAPDRSESEIAALERELCKGEHRDCRLHFTSGDEYEGKINNAFEALQKQKEAAQIERNRQYYEDNIAANRTAAARLSSSIRNSELLYLQESRVRSDTGTLEGGRVWRAELLGDGTVFSRRDRADAGELSVDLLLDCSTSQKSRQEIVSSQAYIISDALRQCGIPCRVSAFCSMTGYTIFRTFRDYTSPPQANANIFEFVANGCNRDGLAIRVMKELIKRESYEHRLLIILSDVKPNDVVKMHGEEEGEFTDYTGPEGVRNTAAEVRLARCEDISVACVFTGTDDCVPSAKLVYGQDIVRITEVGMLADAVGKLVLNAIKNC